MPKLIYWYLSQWLFPFVHDLCNISTALIHIWHDSKSSPAFLLFLKWVRVSRLSLSFNKESRLGELSAHCILFHDHVFIIENSDPGPVIGRPAVWKGNRGKFFIKEAPWLVGIAGAPHVLLADVTSHVGLICLPALWKHVSVSEAGVICHA